MLKRHSSAPATPLSPSSQRRRSSSRPARLKSWWLRVLLLILVSVVGWQAWRVLTAGRQLNPYFSQLSHETVHWSWRKPSCPLEYKRHQWVDLEAGKKRPYLFGGQQEPECTNCEVDKLWSHFCQFKSHVGCSAWSSASLPDSKTCIDWKHALCMSTIDIYSTRVCMHWVRMHPYTNKKC